MNKLWAEMILAGKKKFSDIVGKARREAVKAILEQYVQEGKLEQEQLNEILAQ